MAISSGAATIGTGGTYATLALACADLATLTGNLTFTIISDLAPVAAATVGVSLAGYTLRFTSNNPHYGNPTWGWNVAAAFPGYIFELNPITAGGIIVIDNIRAMRTSGAATTCGFISSDNVVSNTIIIHDCYVSENATGSTNGGSIIRCTTSTNIYFEIYNCIFTNPQYRCIYLGTSVYSNKIYNTICGSAGQYGFSVGASWFLANCYAHNNPSADFSVGTASTWATCASSDATSGTVAYRNLSAATQFISTDMTNPNNFYVPRPDSTIVRSGSRQTNPAVIRDIRGARRPDGRMRYSIGVNEDADYSKTVQVS